MRTAESVLAMKRLRPRGHLTKTGIISRGTAREGAEGAEAHARAPGRGPDRAGVRERGPAARRDLSSSADRPHRDLRLHHRPEDRGAARDDRRGCRRAYVLAGASGWMATSSRWRIRQPRSTRTNSNASSGGPCTTAITRERDLRLLALDRVCRGAGRSRGLAAELTAEIIDSTPDEGARGEQDASDSPRQPPDQLAARGSDPGRRLGASTSSPAKTCCASASAWTGLCASCRAARNRLAGALELAPQARRPASTSPSAAAAPGTAASA